jgi:DNA helicase-2/ATP-dependent DNA helicase PcrA
LSGYRSALLVAGFGPATVRRLLDDMDAASQPAKAFSAFAPPAAARDDWAVLRDLMAQLRTSRDAWPDDLRRVHRWYLPQLERLYDDARVRQADLTQLERIAEGFRNRERFLTELALDPPQSSSDEAGDPHLDEDYLILSTIHSAKGQEWQSVHVLNAVDGCIPADLMTGSSHLIEEERRLLYVAMTRARQHLHLLVPQRFYLSQQGAAGDRHVYASVSRFIPPAVAQLFEPIGPRRPDSDTRLTPLTPTTVAHVDVAAAIRSSWE